MAPPHPGAFIRDEILEELGLSVSAAATALGVRRATLSDLINGNAALSPEMALRVEKAFGVNMETLLRMQAWHDAVAMRAQASEVDVKPYLPTPATEARNPASRFVTSIHDFVPIKPSKRPSSKAKTLAAATKGKLPRRSEGAGQAGRRQETRMIRVGITAEAFDAISALLPSGNVLYERERTAQGGYFVWLDESLVNNLERLRGPRDEDLSAVIVRLFGEQTNEQIAELLGSEQGPSEAGP
jgi:addiction module HigA family antidote